MELISFFLFFVAEEAAAAIGLLTGQQKKRNCGVRHRTRSDSKVFLDKLAWTSVQFELKIAGWS